MTAFTEKEIEAAPGQDVTRKQIRGSSALLAGRFLSIGINFVTQLMIIRYLSTSDYGAFAYALSVVAFLEPFSSLGLRRAITRFIPIYHEKQEYNKLFGTLLLVALTIFLVGSVIVLVTWLFPELLMNVMSGEKLPFLLLTVLILLAPLEALDKVFIGLFASFASARAIFFRKHVFGPVLKFLLILVLILSHSDVLFLAYGTVIVGVATMFVYTLLLWNFLRRQGLFKHFRLRTVTIPAKEIFSFTIPVLTSDLVAVAMFSANALILGYFHGSVEVAYFRVVMPAVKLNQLVMTSFAMLFTPAAARLFAKEDFEGINHLYWKTAVWLAVLSFPIFALTFSASQSLTVFLYGERYASSGIILALLSLGYYFNVALGFNGLTLKVLGKVRYVLYINLTAVVINVVLNFIFIPRYGALGAAIGTSASLIIHNILKQVGLQLASGLKIFERQYGAFYSVIGGSAAVILLVQIFVSRNIFIAIALVCISSAWVFFFTRKNLDIAGMFPVLLRVPLLKSFLR